MPYQNKTIGIIGGMGPMATADLFQKIVSLDAGVTDQQHVRCLVDCNTNIPDRTEAIVSNGESPISEMVRCAVGLEKAGADVLIMGCNTAHYFYDDILPFVRVPFLSILDETCKAIQRNGFDTIGLMACIATMGSGVYASAMSHFGIHYLVVKEQSQREIDTVIFQGVKAGDYSLDPSGLKRAAQELIDAGAQALVLGCTELPVAFSVYSIPSSVPLIDPTSEIAKSALRFVGAKVKE